MILVFDRYPTKANPASTHPEFGVGSRMSPTDQGSSLSRRATKPTILKGSGRQCFDVFFQKARIRSHFVQSFDRTLREVPNLSNRPLLS